MTKSTGKEVVSIMEGLVYTKNLITTDIFKIGGSAPIIEKIKEKIAEHEPDLTTAKGRSEIKSLAAKVAKSKTFLDGLGKTLKADYKAIIDPIDAERKNIRESLDILRDQARKPLTKWENDKKKEEAKKEAEKAFDEALQLNDFFDREKEVKRKEAEIAKFEAERKAQEEKARLEKEKIEREEQIKKDAAGQAKKDAELAIEKAKIVAEKDKQTAIAKLKRDQEEKERLEKERLANEKRIADRKAADFGHRADVNRKVLQKIVTYCSSESSAKELIKDILTNPISEITINY